MTKILIVSSSPKGDQSQSLALAREFADHLPEAAITVRDLAADPVPHLDQATVAAFYTDADERTDAQKVLVARSDALIAEIKAHDLIVVAAPMHNFGVPSALKAWIDHVCRAGETFRYSSNGPEGLLAGRELVAIVTRGGNYGPDGPAPQHDHQTGYFETIGWFLGFDHTHIVRAEATVKSDDGINEAAAELRGIAAGYGLPAAA